MTRRNCKCRLCWESRAFGLPRPPRCSRCGCHPTGYNEIYEGFGTEFPCDSDSGLIEREGVHFEGHPVRVVAHCRPCGRRWVVRGKSQITQIPGHQPPVVPAELNCAVRIPARWGTRRCGKTLAPGVIRCARHERMAGRLEHHGNDVYEPQEELE